MSQKISERKRLANQRNARKSTGPRTPEGKAKSAQNARTHGLFCQEVVLLDEDMSLFKALRHDFIRDLKPQRLCELAMVDKIIESHWKMRRLRLSECVRQESLFDEYFEDHNEVPPNPIEDMKQGEYDIAAATAMAFGLAKNKEGLERMSRYEQRLQNQVHRCYRELRLMRDEMEKIAALPDSPFLETVEQTHNATPSPHRGEGGGEGRATIEKQPGFDSENNPPLSPQGEGVNASAERNELDDHGGANAKMQNEPTESRRFDADVTCEDFASSASEHAAPSERSPAFGGLQRGG